MSEQEIKELLEEGYKAEYFQTYRKINQQLFPSEKTPTCGCEAQRLYQKLKLHYKIE
jgi:hypothetical protein